MRNKIPHLLILISRMPLNAEKSYDTDESSKNGFHGVPTFIAYMIKKELDVYLRVPGNAE